MKFNRKALIKLAKKDIAGFCVKAQVSRQQTHTYLHGEGERDLPSIPTLCRIMDAYGVESEYFFNTENVNTTCVSTKNTPPIPQRNNAGRAR